jgi:S-(hydroxymethyl)glutathione dehydrogenase/alcohol dehydrogenase
VLSWNPHCGHCFYCDRDAPILCEQYLGEGPKGVAFDGETRTRLADGQQLRQLMFLGSFGEYCVVSDQQAIPVPKEIPFDRACLIGCGVMTGAGAALNLGAIARGDARDGDRLRRRRVSRPCRARARGAGAIIPSISIRQNCCSLHEWVRHMASMHQRTMRSPTHNGRPTAAASMS